MAAFAFQWAYFVRRYRGVPNEILSFNLVNEPTGFTEARYEQIVRKVVAAIRKEDPARFVMADGNSVASQPMPGLYGVPALGQDTLARYSYAPWEAADKAGEFVMCGEFGAYARVPHATALAWIEDNLRLFRSRGWGWALWELDGEFGVLDTGRTDVPLEDFNGHKLDRKLLDLLRRYAAESSGEER